MTTKKVTPAREQLADTTPAMHSVDDTGAAEIGALVAVVAGNVGQWHSLDYLFPITAVEPHAEIQNYACFGSVESNPRHFGPITGPTPIATPAGLQATVTPHFVNVERTAFVSLLLTTWSS
jgi:hypothetical protein